jgi:copper(I)-binding protein
MKKTLLYLCFALLILGNLVSLASAEVTINNARARFSSGPNGAVFMDIQGSDDQLIVAEADVCNVVEFHTNINDNGVMRMRPVRFIEINSDETTALRPGGLHIMLIKLKHPLKEGEKFSLTLKFANAGTIVVDVPVRKQV